MHHYCNYPTSIARVPDVCDACCLRALRPCRLCSLMHNFLGYVSFSSPRARGSLCLGRGRILTTFWGTFISLSFTPISCSRGNERSVVVSHAASATAVGHRALHSWTRPALPAHARVASPTHNSADSSTPKRSLQSPSSRPARSLNVAPSAGGRVGTIAEERPALPGAVEVAVDLRPDPRAPAISTDLESASSSRAEGKVSAGSP